MDMLPECAGEDVSWAIGELKARKRTQEEIREEFNLRLLSRGVEPVSRSAFNRYSLYLAARGQELMQAREIAAMFSEKLDEQPDGDIGLLLGETIKTLIYDVVIDSSLSGESPSIAMLLSAAEAVERLEKGRAANVRTAAVKAKEFVKKAADAAETAARARGFPEDVTRQIREQVLGVKA